MSKRQPQSPVSKTTSYTATIAIDRLEKFAADWILEGEFRSHSPKTVENRRIFVKNLLWFLNTNNHQSVDSRSLKEFFIYLSKPHPEGRWGNPRLTKPLRPISEKDYFVNFKIMFNWLAAEGLIEVSPMSKFAPPVVRESQIQPFSTSQVTDLLAAAKKSTHPRRDVAILSLLFDTGIRASECCNLKLKDIDLNARCVSILGKGEKRRTVFFGKATAKAVWQFVRSEERELEDWLFICDRGTKKGEALQRNGLLQLIQRLGQAAKIRGVRCSPHTLRHTYAVSFLRAGGNVFTLKQSLGHTDLEMTQKYVMVAQADLEAQAKMYSPLDRLKL